jgi:hypothetical protein
MPSHYWEGFFVLIRQGGFSCPDAGLCGTHPQRTPDTFTNPEIERMMDAVWSHPQRASEFRRYQEAREVMETAAMYEGKLAMAQAMISIQLQSTTFGKAGGMKLEPPKAV